jgi:hypothetical protein
VMLGTLQPQRRPPNPQPPAGALRHLCRSRRRWPRAPRSCHLSTAAAGTSWDHGPAGKVFQKNLQKKHIFLGKICWLQLISSKSKPEKAVHLSQESDVWNFRDCGRMFQDVERSRLSLEFSNLQRDGGRFWGKLNFWESNKIRTAIGWDCRVLTQDSWSLV